MNFKNNICTTKEQSKRLLFLGLKPETADMYMDQYGLSVAFPYGRLKGHRDERDIAPAWSLSRLLELLPSEIQDDGRLPLRILQDGRMLHIRYCGLENENFYDTMCDNIFDAVIGMMEWLCELGHFNKEYLNTFNG